MLTSKPTAMIPLDRLGPGGTKDELTALAMVENEAREDYARLHDKEPRKFRVSARLGKAPAPPEGIKGDFTPEDGASYLLGFPGADFYRVYVDGLTAEFKLNSKKEHSVIEIECISKDRNEAKNVFLAAMTPFIDHMSFLANVPVVIDTIRIEDLKNQSTTVCFVTPYRNATINSHTSRIDDALIPLFAMYREALNSNSDFYKFLCFYKILEGIYGKLRTNLYINASARNIKLPKIKEQVPFDSHIPLEHRHHIGKPVKEFLDKVLSPIFRDAMAHFATDDGDILNMSSVSHQEKYSQVIFIVQLCVRLAIENYQTLLNQLNQISQIP